MRRLISLSLLLGLTASLIWGQTVGAQTVPAQAGEQSTEGLTSFGLEVTRVDLLFTVSDRRGRFVTDLSKEDFQVFERRNEQEILEFTAMTDLPLRLAILIDTSNSIRERFRFQQAAAIEFINSVVRPDIDKAVVVSFDTGVRLEAELTSDIRALEHAIEDLRPGGGTSLYEAIFDTCSTTLVQEQPLYEYRRAVVILSDGEDNQSRVSRDQALKMAHDADAVLYTISTNTSRIETPGDKVLKYLAEETGGLVFFPFKVEDLSQSFDNIASELRHQYNILYRPNPVILDGRYHEVRLAVKNHRNLTVRVRKGYYATTR